MSAWLQNLLVGLLVAGAALYAVWYYMPAAWRKACQRTLAGAAVRLGLLPAASLHQVPAAPSAKNCRTGCGSCRGCD